MALAIRIVPTLHGEVAKKFEAAAKKVENNPRTLDYRKKAKVVKEYIQKNKVVNSDAKFCKLTIVQFVVVCVFQVVSAVSQAPNGFYSVYRRICFSEWHIVPQLCVQIKQSRVYSRKALYECKASRRLGKQTRGLSRFLFNPMP